MTSPVRARTSAGVTTTVPGWPVATETETVARAVPADTFTVAFPAPRA